MSKNELGTDEQPSSEPSSSERVSLGLEAADQPTQQTSCCSLPPVSASHRKSKHRQIPIVIIDKSALYRAGLRYVLPTDGYRVVGDYSTLDEIPPTAFDHPRCMVLIGLDEVNLSPSQIRNLKEHHDLPVIALSDQSDGIECFSAIDAGADGYLIKDEVTPEILVKALELVLLGGTVIPRRRGSMWKREMAPPENEQARPENVSEDIRPNFGNDAEPPSNYSRLSEREQAILTGLTHGASNKHIARDLNIAEATVKVHVKSVLRKLRVQNRTQAAMRAIEARRELRLPPADT